MAEGAPSGVKKQKVKQNMEGAKTAMKRKAQGENQVDQQLCCSYLLEHC